MTAQRMRAVTERLYRDGGQAELVRSKGERKVWRTSLEGQTTVIVKLWCRSTLGSVVRRLTRTSNAVREYRILRRLQRAGVPVPGPIGYCFLSGSGVQYVEALFLQDLGQCKSGLQYIQEMIENGDSDSLQEFEDEVIAITLGMVRTRVLDRDHSVLNIVRPPSRGAVRVDLEVAKGIVFPSLAINEYAQMLGRLIGTYAFAVQPDMGLARDFATRVADRLGPRRSVLHRAADFVRKMMEKQRRERGIDTRVDLPW